MGRTVYRASRARIAVLVLLCSALAAGIAGPWTLEFLRRTASASRWTYIKALELDVRIVLAFAAAALVAFSAIGLCRFLIHDEAIVVDDEGITVRHTFGDHRGLWADYVDVQTAGFWRFKWTFLRFRSGRGVRSISLPAKLLGVDARHLGDEMRRRVSQRSVDVEAHARLERAMALNPPPSRSVDPILGLDRLKDFGRRPASEAVNSGHNLDSA
jgi:hypothetical protein